MIWTVWFSIHAALMFYYAYKLYAAIARKASGNVGLRAPCSFFDHGRSLNTRLREDEAAQTYDAQGRLVGVPALPSLT